MADLCIETPIESDEFNTRQFGLQWEWHANYQGNRLAFLFNLGYIGIYGHILSKDLCEFLGNIQISCENSLRRIYSDCQTETFHEGRNGQQSGLIVMGWDYGYLGVVKEGDKFISESSGLARMRSNGL